MNRYYLSSGMSEIEVSERVWRSVVGDKVAESYARCIVEGDPQSDEVPEEFLSQATMIADNRLAWYGQWAELDAFAWRSATETVFLAYLAGI